MARGCTRRRVRRGGLLSAATLCSGLTLCLGLTWSQTPGPLPQPAASTVTTASAVTDAATSAGSAHSIVSALDAGAPGPYGSTVAGLVDLDSRIPGGIASGTGIVLSPDGVVVTNYHEVARASTIQATDLGDGRVYSARVLGRDPGHDIAVVRLTGASGLPTAPFGDSDRIRVGDRVAAIGNAGGRGGRPTITTGEITALDRSIVANDDTTHQHRRLRGMIQVSADVQPGDSGGALVGDGGVIGMNTATSPGAGYAIPINTVLAIAHKLASDGGSGPDPGELSSRRSLAAKSGRVGVARVTGRPHGD